MYTSPARLDLHAHDTDVRRIDIDKVENFLESGQRDQCVSAVDTIFDEVGYAALESFMLRLYITMDIYVCARTFSKRFGISGEEFTKQFGTIDDMPRNLDTVSSAKGYFSRMFDKCISWRTESCKSESGAIICKAKKYIYDNYHLEDICLKSVASAVNLSPTYFSALFKKDVGINFIDYLTNVRIDKAKELLCCTSLQISQIACRVGFSDYRYFGQIFKKHTGKTPREFQQTHNS